jgi:hypothetical protein
MREIVTVSVSPGDILQLYSGGSPIGNAITVPSDTSSLTVIFRKTEEFQAAVEKRKEKLSERQQPRGAQGRRTGGRARLGGRRKQQQRSRMIKPVAL